MHVKEAELHRGHLKSAIGGDDPYRKKGIPLCEVPGESHSHMKQALPGRGMAGGRGMGCAMGTEFRFPKMKIPWKEKWAWLDNV